MIVLVHYCSFFTDAAEGMDDTNNFSHEGDGEYQPQSRDARARSSQDAHVVERRIHGCNTSKPFDGYLANATG